MQIDIILKLRAAETDSRVSKGNLITVCRSLHMKRTWTSVDKLATLYIFPLLATLPSRKSFQFVCKAFNGTSKVMRC